MRHFDRDCGGGRTWQAVGPFRGVDGIVEELDTCEMAARRARLIQPVRASRSATVARPIPRTLWSDDVVQQTATVEGFDGGHREAAQPERKLLQRGVRIFGLLQHQHREVGEAQLTSEEQADRACTSNYYVMGIQMATRTNDWTREKRPMFVVGISCRRPKTRAFVTERTWAYQTKSAFSDAGSIALP